MPSQPAPGTAVRSLGLAAAILTTLLTFITFGIAIFTPPLSGPFCTADCFAYPYTDIASRFPRDYLWMYPAMFQMVAFFVLMVCIHHDAPVGKKIFSHIGVSFALYTTMVIITDYFLQVSVVQQSVILGETDGVSLLTQFNPHGIFIVLEELGYVLMSITFVSMAAVFSGRGRLARAIRWLFLLCAVLTALALVVVTVMYGIDREYRFEVAAITINWLGLIVTGILLAILFSRQRADTPVP